MKELKKLSDEELVTVGCQLVVENLKALKEGKKTDNLMDKVGDELERRGLKIEISKDLIRKIWNGEL